MMNINFFESTIDVSLDIHKGGYVAAINHGKTLFESDQYSCMDKIRRMIGELSALGEKTVVFHIRSMVTGDTTSVGLVREYLKSSLLRLNTSTPVNIEVKAGLDLLA